MSSGDLTDLIGEVEILPAGDTDLETQWQRSEHQGKAPPAGMAGLRWWNGNLAAL